MTDRVTDVARKAEEGASHFLSRNAHRKHRELNTFEACEFLMRRERVRREGWPRGCWLLMVEPKDWGVDAQLRFNSKDNQAFIVHCDATDSIAPWLPSAEDLAATDWEVE